MRKLGLMLGLAAALYALPVSAPAIGGYGSGGSLGLGLRARHPRKGKGQNNRRGKGKRSAPKKHSNRLIISKRVRRKHRRTK